MILAFLVGFCWIILAIMLGLASFATLFYFSGLREFIFYGSISSLILLALALPAPFALYGIVASLALFVFGIAERKYEWLY